jgi:TetR/AcrR family transcriptional regulator, regulator of cefoperazone and chloramphenicol sensitivity
MSRKKVNAREALLIAAERLFAHRWYSCIGTREIAEQAGVNLGLIGYYFGSKRQLFVEVVQRILRGGGAVAAHEALQMMPSTPDPERAAVILCRFIKCLMGDLLQAKGGQITVVYREVLGCDSEPEVLNAIISMLTTEFMEPTLTALVNVLATLTPAAPAAELQLAARSIIAQCVFYLTSRSCLERLAGKSLAEPLVIDEIARHVARFSLRAIRCDEARIQKALNSVFRCSEI